MKVDYQKSFIEDVKKLNDKKIISRVNDIITHVKDAAAPSDISQLKKLQGFKHAYRIRIGDYRIGIEIKFNTVTFVRVLDRKEIYKRFP